MFESKLVINNKYKELEIARIQAEMEEVKKTLISVNPFYDWLDENINNISYKLLKGFITNIVPLGDAGKKYFKKIAHKRVGFTAELWKLYNQLEKMNHQGTLKRVSYFELYNLGYNGAFLGERYPVDDVIKYLK